MIEIIRDKLRQYAAESAIEEENAVEILQEVVL